MQKNVSMKMVLPNSAGIDVGSRSHFVAVGQDEGDVREFGVYTKDHQEMIGWLHHMGITHVAMESTGSYWQTLFRSLQEAGFDVLLANGNQTKNVRGKTDVKDCQWIQKLHSMGLLNGSFLPSNEVQKMKDINRHRDSLIRDSSKYVNRMQKSLRAMNMRLDVAISDITGKSGLRIIEAIISGQFNPTELAKLTDPRVKKTQEEIADALTGNWNQQHINNLRDCYEIYNLLQSKIDSCEQQLQSLLRTSTKFHPPSDTSTLTKKQRTGKNQPKMNLSLLSYQYYGVDLFAITSVSYSTVMTLLSEVGNDIYKFESSKHWVSWLRLAPNNRISGGKVISSRTPKGKGHLTMSLRNAANTIGNTKEGHLAAFFKKIAYKKGRGAAITATARKIAVIIFNMISKREEYKPIPTIIQDEKTKRRIIAKTEKRLLKMGFSNISISAC
jgi:transposase